MYIDNLKGQDGEIGLRIENTDYFSFINVGDDKGLLKICEAYKMWVDEKDFSTTLFHDINSKGSKVALLDSNNANFEAEYNFLVKKTEDRLIGKLKELKEIVRKK